MALTGVHIVFAPIATGIASTALPFGAEASQTMASPTTSSIVASANSKLLSINASAPIFYATGKNPKADGTVGYPRRYYDPTSGQREDVFVSPGDKFVWTFA